MYALIDDHSIVVTEGSARVSIAAADPTYGPVRRYLVDERGEDFAVVRDLIERFRVGVKATTAEAVSVVDGDCGDEAQLAYRLEHGDPVEEVMLAAAIRLTNSDSDLAPLGGFLRRLERNPSAASRSQLRLAESRRIHPDHTGIHRRLQVCPVGRAVRSRRP